MMGKKLAGAGNRGGTIPESKICNRRKASRAGWQKKVRTGMIRRCAVLQRRGYAYEVYTG